MFILSLRMHRCHRLQTPRHDRMLALHRPSPPPVSTPHQSNPPRCTATPVPTRSQTHNVASP
eukprot:10364015-Prorocentrum_lima.AAC.1